jgi:sulfur relay (sulfurtransferase) complex TusBCD TusD component (DsrE family)
MCPHCAASVGCETGNLADGARFGQQGELARVVLEADKVLDY